MATCIYRGAFARYPIVTTSGSPGRCLPRNAVKTEIHFLSLPFLALPSLSFSFSFSFKHTFFPPRSSIPPLCDPYTRACFPVTHEIISQNLSRTATSPSVSFSPYLETDSRSSRNSEADFYRVRVITARVFERARSRQRSSLLFEEALHSCTGQRRNARVSARVIFIPRAAGANIFYIHVNALYHRDDSSVTAIGAALVAISPAFASTCSGRIRIYRRVFAGRSIAANRASLFRRPVKLFFCLSRRRASLGKRSDRREPAKDARAPSKEPCRTRARTRGVTRCNPIPNLARLTPLRDFVGAIERSTFLDRGGKMERRGSSKRGESGYI